MNSQHRFLQLLLQDPLPIHQQLSKRKKWSGGLQPVDECIAKPKHQRTRAKSDIHCTKITKTTDELHITQCQVPIPIVMLNLFMRLFQCLINPTSLFFPYKPQYLILYSYLWLSFYDIFHVLSLSCEWKLLHKEN